MVILLALVACEEPAPTHDAPTEPVNTLNDPSVGNGLTGNIDNYFYDFSKNYDVTFYCFDYITFGLSYDEYHTLYGYEPKTVRLRTFPDYLISIHPGETQYTERSIIDSLPPAAMAIEDSVTISSVQFKNIDSLVWDLEPEIQLQRYKPTSSDWIYENVVEHYIDTAIAFNYQAVIDTPLIETGLMFVDHSEWKDTTYVYSSTTLPFSHTFTFDKKQISADSLMYRNNCDCNDNGQWDDAETVDVGNGIWDPAEVFVDIDHDGQRDGREPFEDRNCNGRYDGAETLTLDSNGNGYFDPGDEFVDVGNGLIDGAEVFTDLDQDGEPDPNELFSWKTIPNTLLANWADPQNPVPMIRLTPGDSLVTRWGITYQGVLETIVLEDHQVLAVDKIDSLVTVYTNRIITNIPGDYAGDYFITKTEWTLANGDRDYDYQLFRKNGNIFQLTHPTYFKPDGFTNQFWVSNQLKDEVLFYTVNGQLRDGEQVSETYYDTTAVAIYKIEKSYQVEADTITVPGRSTLGFEQSGLYACFADTNIKVTDPQDCPAADTTFAECFKITRVMTMTMIGNGVEYGQRSVTWLARNRGIVKDELYVRWSEPFGIDGELWIGASKWELGAFTSNLSGQAGRWLNALHRNRLGNLQSLPEFDEDPYRISHSAGFQRVPTAEEN